MACRAGASHTVARLLLAVLVIAAPGTGASDAFTQRAGAAAADLDTLLQRTGAYARDFALAFTRIIGHERYDQRLQRNTRHLSRLLESDVFFLGLDGEGAWITVRDVRRVDGRSVSGSRERIDQALAGDRRDERRLLRQLADEGRATTSATCSGTSAIRCSRSPSSIPGGRADSRSSSVRARWTAWRSASSGSGKPNGQRSSAARAAPETSPRQAQSTSPPMAASAAPRCT